MSVLDDILNDAQPGYETQVRTVLVRLLDTFGEAAFDETGKPHFIGCVVRLLNQRPQPSQEALQLISDLSAMIWWCGLPISDEVAGAIAALVRRIHYQDAAATGLATRSADPAARTAHAVFAGTIVNRLHSPTRGAFDYVRALAADPDAAVIEIFHQGALTPELQAYGGERFAGLRIQPRFVAIDADADFLLKALQNGPRTFHFWCETPFADHVTLMALFGPTVMFTCGDAAPVQFADAYWYCHESGYIEALWRRRGAPETFIANYRQTQSVAFNRLLPGKTRTRADFGFGPDDVIVVSAGNRLSVDIDEAFVDGMGKLVLSDPRLRWVMVGGLQEFWVTAFTSVLGDQFTHLAFDPDLASLLAVTDIFANPFRAGGGNTAIMAIDAGAVVATRGDLGDVGAFVPVRHRAPDAGAYFADLKDLASDRVLRAARLAEQQALIDRRLDQDEFARELKGLVGLAYERFAARTRGTLEALYAQPPIKTAAGPRRRSR